MFKAKKKSHGLQKNFRVLFKKISSSFTKKHCLDREER